MNGIKREFPIIFESIDLFDNKDITVNDEDELIDFVDKYYRELKEHDDKVKIIHAFTQLKIGADFELGTIQIMDKRIKQLLDLYEITLYFCA